MLQMFRGEVYRKSSPVLDHIEFDVGGRWCYEGGGGTTTQTNQTQSAPWGPAQPALQDLLTQATNTYNSQNGNTLYNNGQSTVAPFSADTQQGLDLTAQRALAGSPVGTAANTSVTNMLNGSAPGTSTLSNLAANGYSDSGAPITAGVAAMNPNSAPGMDVMSGWANPNNINPYLNAEYSAASQPVINSTNAQFTSGGRTGSAANQSVLTTNLGNLSANIYGTGYEDAANRSLSAANDLNGAYNTGVGQKLNAAGQLSTDSANQAGARASAANNLNSSTLNAAQLAPSLAGMSYTDLQNLLNVGGAQDAQSQAQLNDLLTQWQYSQSQPWSILQQYGGAINGLGALGGTSSSTGTSTAPKTSLIPQLLGAGISAGLAPVTGGGSLLGNFLGG